jgi:hypothetical protein
MNIYIYKREIGRRIYKKILKKYINRKGYYTSNNCIISSCYVRVPTS